MASRCYFLTLQGHEDDPAKMSEREAMEADARWTAEELARERERRIAAEAKEQQASDELAKERERAARLEKELTLVQTQLSVFLESDIRQD